MFERIPTKVDKFRFSCACDFVQVFYDNGKGAL